MVHKTVRFFDPGRGYTRIKPHVDGIMQRVLAKGDLILREDLEEFEKNLAEYLGTKYAVGVASGTDALILTLKALGITGEVLVPSYTFRATVEAVVHAGATPVLVDMGDDWRDYKTEATQAIIPAHIAGEILDWEPDDDVVMIEDAAQAIGASEVKGIAATYSFYPAKILGCYGDGGAVATNDENLYNELLKLRNHYKGGWEKVAYNSRLDNLQAAVLNLKLKYLPYDIARRKEIAEMYDKELSLIVETPKQREVYQDYIIRCANKFECDSLFKFLAGEGIETMKNGYPFPTKYPKGLKAQEYEDESLRLPCNPELEDEEVKYVIKKIKEFYKR